MRAGHHRYTWREYLSFEESSNRKHEFLGGEIYAMAGGTPEHARLAAKVIAALERQTETGPCRVYSSDLRVRVQETGLGTYPDATVICGELLRDPEDKNTAVNPTVIFEVTSDSTEEYDRTTKFEHYQRCPSLQEYVLVSHRERCIEVFRRTGETWTRSEARTSAVARLGSISVELEIDALYDGIDIPG